ncbi:MAG: hypothetical protein IPN36_15720 [Bacteroidetes bacterium]|nr:hypothetical protein [Bacteroidota bacterium]
MKTKFILPLLKLWIIGLILSINHSAFAQNVVPSNAFVETCYNKVDCYRISNSAFIFKNNITGEFLLQVDFSKFKIGNDTLDDWLNDLSKTYFVFDGQLSPADIISINNNSSRPCVVNGTLHFNGYTKPYRLELNFFRSSGTGPIISNSTPNYVDRPTVSMQIAFHAKDFHIGNRSHHYKKTIRLAISRGYVNDWSPEVNAIIKH